MKKERMHHSELVFRLTARGWNPNKKEEIVGKVSIARIAPVPNIPPIPGMNPAVSLPSPIFYPFALIYLPLDELALAVSGTPALNFGLELRNENLFAVLKTYFPDERNVIFRIKSDGLISSRVQTFVREDGRRRVYLPLEDVAKALGGRLEVNQTAWTFSIKTGNYVNCLLEQMPFGNGK